LDVKPLQAAGRNRLVVGRRLSAFTVYTRLVVFCRPI
jgi:hypothetical protein